MLRALLIASLLTTSTLAEISVQTSKVQVVVGLVNPRIVGDRLLVEEGSNPGQQPGGIITVTHDAKFARVKARRTLFDAAPIEKLSDNSWLVVGAGRYLVEVSTFDPSIGLDERTVELVIGDGIQPPTPPTPPVPPTPPPEPIPDPVPDVDNTYNVGHIAFTNAPHDAAGAKTIAGFYRNGANRLFGQGSLSDVQSILDAIKMQCDSKPCTDRETCEKWKAWYQAIRVALINEQTKRGTFTRHDWFNALTEIAKALEVVK